MDMNKHHKYTKQGFILPDKPNTRVFVEWNGSKQFKAGIEMLGPHGWMHTVHVETCPTQGAAYMKAEQYWLQEGGT